MCKVLAAVALTRPPLLDKRRVAFGGGRRRNTWHQNLSCSSQKSTSHALWGGAFHRAV